MNANKDIDCSSTRSVSGEANMCRCRCAIPVPQGDRNKCNNTLRLSMHPHRTNHE